VKPLKIVVNNETTPEDLINHCDGDLDKLRTMRREFNRRLMVLPVMMSTVDVNLGAFAKYLEAGDMPNAATMMFGLETNFSTISRICNFPYGQFGMDSYTVMYDAVVSHVAWLRTIVPTLTEELKRVEELAAEEASRSGDEGAPGAGVRGGEEVPQEGTGRGE
jgi:hypothetical protein